MGTPLILQAQSSIWIGLERGRPARPDWLASVRFAWPRFGKGEGPTKPSSRTNDDDDYHGRPSLTSLATWPSWCLTWKRRSHIGPMISRPDVSLPASHPASIIINGVHLSCAISPKASQAARCELLAAGCELAKSALPECSSTWTPPACRPGNRASPIKVEAALEVTETGKSASSPTGARLAFEGACVWHANWPDYGDWPARGVDASH